MAIFVSKALAKADVDYPGPMGARRIGYAPAFSTVLAYSGNIAVFVSGLAGASPAFASYAQMRLEGLGAILILMVLGIHAFLVVVLLFFKLFRRRVIMVVNMVLSVLWASLLMEGWNDFQKLAMGITRVYGGEVTLLLLLVMLLVVLCVIGMPLRQYRASPRRFKA